MRLKRKQVDDVLGGDEMWAHADRTQGMAGLTRGKFLTLSFQLASCDKCNFNSAFFYQLQIRSADEPMTTCAVSIISDFLILLISGKCSLSVHPLAVTISQGLLIVFLLYLKMC